MWLLNIWPWYGGAVGKLRQEDWEFKASLGYMKDFASEKLTVEEQDTWEISQGGGIKLSHL